MLSLYRNKSIFMARPKTNPDTVEKVCKTCQKTFVISFYLRNKRTYCSKSCANHDPEVVAKMVASQEETFKEKYGMHPMKTEKTKQNLRDSVKEKYGVDWISSSEGWYDKVKENNLIKYGTEIYNNIEQMKETCLEKYGVDNYRKTDEYKEKYKETCLKKYGVPHASQSESFKVEHYTSIFEKFMDNPRFKDFNPLFSFKEYQGVSFKKYEFECIRCNNKKSHSIDNGKSPICPNCDKINSSFFQKEIYDYVNYLLGNSVDIQINDRKILYPKELDIVIPSLNLAIECNGLVWHSEIIGHKNKVYHLNKSKASIFKGYKLIHIFENEWNNKQSIVKSMLSMALGKIQNKVHGRDCEIKEIDSSTCSIFLDENHIQGMDHSSIKLGLFHNKELVSVMTFVKSRFDKKVELEMSRFCNKLNCHTHGGASKLFTYFIKNYNPQSIVSYSDRRYFDGNLYVKLGFRFVYNSSPNYHYIIDNYQSLQNRMAWQKHKLSKKLKIFDPTLTEWENMKNNGFDRIWDCGCGKWIWNTNH